MLLNISYFPLATHTYTKEISVIFIWLLIYPSPLHASFQILYPCFKSAVLFFPESFFIPPHTDSQKWEQGINLNLEGLKLVIWKFQVQELQLCITQEPVCNGSSISHLESASFEVIPCDQSVLTALIDPLGHQVLVMLRRAAGTVGTVG